MACGIAGLAFDEAFCSFLGFTEQARVEELAEEFFDLVGFVGLWLAVKGCKLFA